MTATSVPLPPMAWNAWGDPARVTELSPDLLGMVHAVLGVSAADVRAVEREQVRVRPSALRDDDHAALAGVVGSAYVTTADEHRLLRAGGKSTLDLLRRRSAAQQDAPDAVIAPCTDDEVAEVLAVCAERGLAVVPFGG